MSDVTRILETMRGGDERAADRLLTAVYDELRNLANAKIAREPAGQTLQATALVHEAYLRIVDENDTHWKDRTYFFAAAAEAMRRILVEQARRRARLKHGGGRQREELAQAEEVATPEPSTDLIALDEALAKLAHEDPQKADLVKLRHFTGLTIEQAAEVLGISRATADRHWAYARAWLYHEIRRGEDSGACQGPRTGPTD